MEKISLCMYVWLADWDFYYESVLSTKLTMKLLYKYQSESHGPGEVQCFFYARPVFPGIHPEA